MGLSSKKSTTSQVQNTTSNATTAPNVPDWLLQPAQALGSNLSDMIKAGPSAFTPQTSGLQTRAFTGAGDLSTSPLYGDAASAVKGVAPVGAESLLDGLDRYYSPFKDQVLNPVLSDYDENSGRVRAAQAAGAAQNGGSMLRGSRFGIREAQTEGQLARGRATAEGGLLHDMFDTATSLSGQDAARRQSAAEGNASRTLQGAGLLSGIANDQGAADRANVGVQDLLGQQATDQGNAQRSFPVTYQQQLEGLFAGLDPSTFTGQTINSTGTAKTDGTTKSSDSLLSNLGTAAQIAALFI